MTIFVTGVGGQLGHDVMNELHKRGYRGIGSDIASQYSGIADGSAVTTMPYMAMDITDADMVRQVLTQANPDVVVLCNTGCRINTIERKLSTADAAVVGTTFKRNGIFEERVDVERVAAFMEVVRKFRENL